jgi:Na+-transporting methylmalonyl-CoA/oxaloacetate decarboxylase gamma subunit
LSAGSLFVSDGIIADTISMIFFYMYILVVIMNGTRRVIRSFVTTETLTNPL